MEHSLVIAAPSQAFKGSLVPWCAAEIASLLKSKIFPDFAPALHAEAIRLLEKANFVVTPEFKVPSGRIDIVCYKDGQQFAIELDTRKPRKKSIVKLREFHGYRIIGLRGVGGDPPKGIQLLVNIPVKLASKAIKSDRRSTRRYV